MNSQTEENYLKTLYHLENQDEEVTITKLSRELKVSMPSVNSMVKRLHIKKLLTYRKYKPLELTNAGRKMALLIIRKHRLVEIFLVEKMGFGWEEVHEIAEQMEHIRSPKFFERIEEILGHPKVDPHGSPIPDKEGNIQFNDYKMLSECAPNDTVIIRALANSSKSFLDYLNKKGLKLGVKLTIKEIEAFDKSVLAVLEGDREETLTAQASVGLLVEKA
ncbi:MAG: metal-dependent transcriptional regulator [Bacteroidota bacterium]